MTGRDLVPVAMLGVGQFGALIWLLNLAVARAAPSRVALVFAALPILTAALAVLLGRGWPTRRTALGIAAGTAGVAILLGGAATGTAPGSAEPLGLLLALGGTMIAALCSLLYRPHLVRYGVLRVSVVAMLASLAPLAVLTLREPAAPLGGWDARSVGLVGFVGASSAVGYLMWLGALARLDAAVVTAFLALSPVTAAGLSAAAFGTSLAATDLAAMGLVAGSLLSLALPRPPASGPGCQIVKTTPRPRPRARGDAVRHRRAHRPPRLGRDRALRRHAARLRHRLHGCPRRGHLHRVPARAIWTRASTRSGPMSISRTPPPRRSAWM